MTEVGYLSRSESPTAVKKKTDKKHRKKKTRRREERERKIKDELRKRLKRGRAKE